MEINKISLLSLGTLALGTASILTAMPVQAATILSTDFNGRNVSGATASNLTWITNGVSDPGNLTADFNLFNTLDTQNLFAVQRNLHNQGDWTVDIAIGVGSQKIELSEISLDGFIFSNAGTAQINSRDFDLKIDLLNSDKNSTLDSVSQLDLFSNSTTNPNPSPVPFVFNFSGNTLNANTTYFLRLTASGTGPGNNSGIDNLVVNGDLVPSDVPEPSTMLGASAALSFGGFFKKKFAKKKNNTTA